MADVEPSFAIRDSNETPADTYLRGATDDTRIGNIGDALKVISPEPKTFSVLAQSVAIGNNKSMISIVNASGSTVKVKLKEIYIKNVQISGLTGVAAIFQLRKIVGHSAGTALTPLSHDSSDSLGSSVTVRTGATVTSEGNSYRRWYWSSDEWGPGPADTESADHALQNLIAAYKAALGQKPITLNAAEGVHIKQEFNSSNGTFDLEMVFIVE